MSTSQNYEDIPENTPTVSSSKRKSPVHNHFNFCENTKKYNCKYCSASYVKENNSGTGNLIKHLKSKHPLKLQNATPPTTINSPIISELKKAEFSKEEFHNKLVNFIIMTDQPFCNVETESFMDLLGYVSPSTASIPKRKAIKNKIIDMYNLEKVQGKQELQNAPGKISLVVDCWSTRNGYSFHGIMATFVDTNFNYKQLVLNFVILEGPHKGKTLAESVFKTLEDFEITDKLMCITSDNASNMDKIFSELKILMEAKGLSFEEENQRIRCFAHIINLSCQAALTVIKKIGPRTDFTCETFSDSSSDEAKKQTTKIVSIYDRIKRAVQKIRKSNVLSESLRHFCESMHINHLSLINDMPVRWNSTYKMLKRCLALRLAFDATMRSDKQLCLIVLTENEWVLVEEMITFLEPFNTMTEKMSQQYIRNMAFTAAFYMDMYDHLESYKVNQGHHELILKAAKLACEKLNKYYPQSDGLAYVMGLVLNPRCKLEWYRQVGFENLVSKYKKAIKACWTKFYKPAAPNSSNEEDADDIFFRQMKRSRVCQEDELDKYIAEPICSIQDVQNGTLDYWKGRVQVYPHLSKMVIDFLGASATGVPMECLFSMGTDLLCPKRLSMLEDTIRICLCLKGWLKFKNQGNFNEDRAKSVVQKMMGESGIEL